MGGVESFSVNSLNRQSVTRNGNTTGYTPNALNQYTTIGGQTLDYDWNFNLKSFDGATFAYNAQNQLVSASKGGKTVQFLYDGLGRCVRRTVNGVATSIAYDGWKPVVERDLSGNTKAVNVYGAGPDEILWRTVPGLGDFRYHHDARGNVMFVLDGGGYLVEKYSYDAFGRPRIMDWNGNERTQTAIGNRFLFQGREWIPELGIYDYRRRIYNPGLGRFLETDPLGLQTEGEKLSVGQKALFSPGGQAPEAFGSSEMNLYRYCHNDPVNKSDPTGLVWVVDKGLQKQFNAARAYLSQDPGMKKAFDAVAASKTNVYVKENKSLASGDTKTQLLQNPKTGEFSVRINWNPHAAASVKGGSQSPAMVLGHEGQHGERYIRDQQEAIRDTNARVPGFGNREEQRIITGPEANAARTLGETPRSSGDARFYPVEGVTDR